MLRSTFAFALGALALGCGASYPVPTQRLANAQSATQSARELGADGEPRGQLHLKLAEEQLVAARAKLKDDDTKRADFLLVRANADAELARALAQERRAKTAAQRAADELSAQSTKSREGGKTP